MVDRLGSVYMFRQTSQGQYEREKPGDLKSVRAAEVKANTHPYKVDGEVGRFEFTTHDVLHDLQAQYDTARELFHELKAKGFYGTTGFKEIAMIYGDTAESYCKTHVIYYII